MLSNKPRKLFMTNFRRLGCNGGGVLSKLARLCCYVLFALFIIEFIVINILAFQVYRFFSNEMAQMSAARPSAPLLDKLQYNENIKQIFTVAKAGGFASLIQETLERLYIVHETVSEDSLQHDVNGKTMKGISFIGLDVSHSGESTFLYSRILSRDDFPFHFLIVDIGANDGLVSSNSFNFIQWGWDAVLVEPQPDQMRMAKMNVKRYTSMSGPSKPEVSFIQAVISNRDGVESFVVKPNSMGTESHISEYRPHSEANGDVVINVQSLTVATFAFQFKIPKNFGILSIDAEGAGAAILRQFMDQKFRPAYIIHERIHARESLRATIDYMKMFGYDYLGQKGWNVIFEYTHTETGKAG